MSSSNSPCAACKFLRRKCTQECAFAPYFPPDQPQRFVNVHTVFGASNVSKILRDLNEGDRQHAANSLVYEAEARMSDPVHGCVGTIWVLQQKLRQVQMHLMAARKDLYGYMKGTSAMLSVVPQQHINNPSSSAYNGSMMSGPPNGGQFVIDEQQLQQMQFQFHQQQMFEARQMAAVAAARKQKETLRSYGQHQQELVRFSSGFEMEHGVGASSVSQCLDFQLEQNQQELQRLLQTQNPFQQHQPKLCGQQPPGSRREEGRSIGPSC